MEIQKLNLQQYQIDASRTCPNLDNIKDNIIHMVSGILTEWGELADIYKKHLAYGKEIDIINLAEEWADGVWYLSNLTRILNEPFIQDEERMKELFVFMLDEKFPSNLSCIISFSYYFNEAPQTWNMLYYWISLGYILEIDMQKALDNNIAKLKVRFPEKFDAEKALNRNLENERKELEK